MESDRRGTNVFHRPVPDALTALCAILDPICCRRPAYRRGEPLIVRPLFDRCDVGVSVTGAFVDFLEKYRGPIDSVTSGLLCDLLASGG